MDNNAFIWARRLLLAALLTGLGALCLLVLTPFLTPIVWAAILAFASWPLYRRLRRLLHRRHTDAVLLLPRRLLDRPPGRSRHNVLRPVLISSAIRVPLLLVMFGALGGLDAFGLMGLLIGPVILATGLAIWREWTEQAAPPVP